MLSNENKKGCCVSQRILNVLFCFTLWGLSLDEKRAQKKMGIVAK